MVVALAQSALHVVAQAEVQRQPVVDAPVVLEVDRIDWIALHERVNPVNAAARWKSEVKRCQRRAIRHVRRARIGIAIARADWIAVSIMGIELGPSGIEAEAAVRMSAAIRLTAILELINLAAEFQSMRAGGFRQISIENIIIGNVRIHLIAKYSISAQKSGTPSITYVKFRQIFCRSCVGQRHTQPDRTRVRLSAEVAVGRRFKETVQ